MSALLCTLPGWQPACRAHLGLAMYPKPLSSTAAGCCVPRPPRRPFRRPPQEEAGSLTARPPRRPRRNPGRQAGDGPHDRGRRLSHPLSEAATRRRHGDLLPRRAADLAEPLPAVPPPRRGRPLFSDDLQTGRQLGRRHQALTPRTADAAVEAGRRAGLPQRTQVDRQGHRHPCRLGGRRHARRRSERAPPPRNLSKAGNSASQTCPDRAART